jgi:glycosyltransferase involved in cell wall biosynthesis
VPPGAYGGTERVIATLCDGLVDLGHDVTLYAPKTSQTRATLVAKEEPLRERLGSEELMSLAPHLHLEMMAEVYSRADEYDVVHSHLDIWTLPFSRLRDTPTVLTMHGRLDLGLMRDLLPRYASAPLVSISDDQRRAVEDLRLNWAATVYNGLDLTAYHEVPHVPDGYLAFVGRIAEEKGPLAAIEISKRSGLPLRMAAKVDPLDVDYYENVVRPQMNGIEFVGEIQEHEKPGFYAGARATLFPSDWPEPFGLVMIESLAAGTPVIALRRFICDDVDEMVKAAARIGEIDRDECRRQAERFSGEAMCRGYLDVYGAVIGEAQGRRDREVPPRAATRVLPGLPVSAD